MPPVHPVDVVVIASIGGSLVSFRGDLLRELRRNHQRVLALAPELSQETRAWLDREGISYLEAPLRRTGTNPLADLRFAAWLWRCIRKAAPRAVLAYTAKPVVYGMLVSSVEVRRYALITGLGYAFTAGAGDRARVRRMLELLYRMALRRAHLVFFQNADDEALFRAQGLLPPGVPSKVLAGSGVDVISFPFTPIPPGAPVFLLIARLLGDKGVREYVAAARILKARHPQAIFRLVGWIDTNPDAIRQDELDRWNEEGDVEYLGKLQDVRAAIAAASVYVLPSYREGTPRTVLEAMAMGRPIITTDAPGCRETVTNDHNGFLVPVGCVEPLAEAMERFILRPELCVQMGQHSRQVAEAKYDVRKVTAEMLQAMDLCSAR